MPEGPLGFRRFTTLGPFVKGDSNGGIEDNPYDDGFEWAVNDELAHFIWQRVDESDFINWGPDPPLLIETDMDFGFEQDSMNMWFFTRDTDMTHSEHTEWGSIPTRFRTDDVNYGQNTSVLFTEDMTPNPVSSKLVSQLYTEHGAMITFDLKQEWGEPAEGMIRIPLPEEYSDRADKLDSEKFEFFEFQNRFYSSQFGNPPEGRDTYFHPHYSSGPIFYADEYIEWFDKAFALIESGFRLEESTG